VEVLTARSLAEVRRALEASLDAHADLLPADRSARVVLKPNLNANMNALTGNTTDLRVIAALLGLLRDRGYADITVAEGTNSGYYRNQIGVISRLTVDKLARRFGAKVVDCNHAGPDERVKVAFDDGSGSTVTARAAAVCANADLLVNLPKLKTHFEAGMSVCLKNMMGTLVGQESKKHTHRSLAANILRLNDVVAPHLHVVDGLVAMEGLGPTRGTPVAMDLLVVGRDPFLVDLACARLARFDHRAVTTLALAEDQGRIGPGDHAYVDSLGLEERSHPFAPPKAGPIASFIHHPRRQKYFLAVRNTRFFTWLASTEWFGALLFKTGLRQDVFDKHEMRLEALHWEEELCKRCGACARFCPLGLDPVEQRRSEAEECLHCLYCYMICPNEAVRFEGDKGFLEEQMRQYDALIRRLARQEDSP
jgi:uncharacterized protein (DUF362 family)/ferredoxin